MPGLLDDFSLGGSTRVLARIELALRQYPGLFSSQSHDGDLRAQASSQDNATSGQDRYSCVKRISHVNRMPHEWSLNKRPICSKFRQPM